MLHILHKTTILIPTPYAIIKSLSLFIHYVIHIVHDIHLVEKNSISTTMTLVVGYKKLENVVHKKFGTKPPQYFSMIQMDAFLY